MTEEIIEDIVVAVEEEAEQAVVSEQANADAQQLEAEKASLISQQQLIPILEAALFAAGEPITLDRLLVLFQQHEKPTKAELREALDTLAEQYEGHALELKQVATGFRFQAKQDYAPWLQRMWERKPPRYSRALLETLALIIYRQPITRGEIEDVRGVAVSSNIIKTLLEREWITVVGHRDVPGKPALFATTKQFLADMNLKSLKELPPLTEIVNLEEVGEKLSGQLELPMTEGDDQEDLAADVELESEQEVESGSEADIEVEAEFEVELDSEAEIEVETELEGELDSEAEIEAETELEVELDFEAELDSEVKIEAEQS